MAQSRTSEAGFWDDYRALDAFLHARPRPGDFGMIAFDLCIDDVLDAFVAAHLAGIVAAYPMAWGQRVLGRVLADSRRRHGGTVELGESADHFASSARKPPPVSGAAGLWNWLDAHWAELGQVLTARQLEVLRHFQRTHSVKASARLCGLTPAACRVHLSRVAKKNPPRNSPKKGCTPPQQG